jgi:hypothetical protein
MCRTTAHHELVKDIVFIFLGVIIAVVLAGSGFLDGFIGFLGNGIIASFVAGVFFTSAFTIAPASVVFVPLVEPIPISTLALWGALGALCGDLILFFFIRDRFANDIKNSFRPSFIRHIAHSFHFGFLKWLAPILGAFIIASPLPDELGLTLMGLSKTRVAVMVPISFVMNLLGIYLLVWFASVI